MLENKNYKELEIHLKQVLYQGSDENMLIEEIKKMKTLNKDYWSALHEVFVCYKNIVLNSLTIEKIIKIASSIIKKDRALIYFVDNSGRTPLDIIYKELNSGHYKNSNRAKEMKTELDNLIYKYYIF